LTEVSEVFTASIIIALMMIRAMMEAVGIFEKSVNFYEATRCNIPEDKSSSGVLW
jgi:hypothetical protein